MIGTHMAERTGLGSLHDIARELGILGDEQIEALRRRLNAMVRDGQLRVARSGQFGMVDKMNLIQGVVRGHPDGFGFLIPDDGSTDIFLNPLQMTCAFDGDKILVRISGKDFKGRPEGKIVDVVTHNTQQLVGRFKRTAGMGFVSPENRRITLDVLVNLDGSVQPDEGDIVLVDLIAQPKFRQQPVGKVVEILGKHMAPGMEIDIAIQSFNIPNIWPDAVVRATDSVPQTVRPQDYQDRFDLTKLPFITIDGEDARDFDDAVYAKAKPSGGWTLYVAIADVSHYVAPGTALDVEATTRATSVYFPERVIPMLPHALSNGICSLNPGVERLAMVCEMQLDANGTIENYQFSKAVIHSYARTTYTQVAAMLQQQDTPEGQTALAQFSHVTAEVTELYQLFLRLNKARKVRGAIDFEATETRIIFDDHKKISQIVPVIRNDAHKLIEECMLCANTCAADFLTQLKIHGLYRVHEGPGPDKLEKLRGYLGELGLALGGGLKPQTKGFQVLLSAVKQRDDVLTLQTVILRSLSQAVYQPENLGHFGLGYEGYAHFTSPIRRYPDLLMHRAINSVIHSDRATPLVKRTADCTLVNGNNLYPYNLEAMLVLGEQSSMAERRADDATRDVMSWLKCEYMEEHIGSVFHGKVTAVVPFGLFVQLHEVFIEGLIHITGLSADYYHYDDAKHRLVGEHTRKVYALGDEVTIRVSRVDLDERKIDFELFDVKTGTAPSGQKPRKSYKAKAKGTADGQTAGKPKTKRKPKSRSSTAVGDSTDKTGPKKGPKKGKSARKKPKNKSAQKPAKKG